MKRGKGRSGGAQQRRRQRAAEKAAAKNKEAVSVSGNENEQPGVARTWCSRDKVRSNQELQGGETGVAKKVVAKEATRVVSRG